MTGRFHLLAALVAAGDAADAARQALEPLPASPPIGGPFWTVLVPALLLAGSFVGTLLLYRRFAGTAAAEADAGREEEVGE